MYACTNAALWISFKCEECKKSVVSLPTYTHICSKITYIHISHISAQQSRPQLGGALKNLQRTNFVVVEFWRQKKGKVDMIFFLLSQKKSSDQYWTLSLITPSRNPVELERFLVDVEIMLIRVVLQVWETVFSDPPLKFYVNVVILVLNWKLVTVINLKWGSIIIISVLYWKEI